MIFPLWSIPGIAVIVWALWRCEKKFPATEQPMAAVILDWKLAGLRIGMTQLIGPLAAASGVMIVSAMGGGWVHLRSDGWWFLSSLVVVILATDLWSYIVHRAMHKFP